MRKKIYYGKARWLKASCLVGGMLLFPMANFAMNEVDGADADMIAAVQQNRTLRGTVLDDSSLPVVGATVLEKGTSNGSITDVDGKFTLNLRTKNPVLIVSFVGYETKEVSVGNSSSMTINLSEDTQVLEDVVVVGYGVQKRASVTGSVASVQSKELTTVKSPSVTNTLAGKLPGLRAVQRSGAPGDDGAGLDIRGLGSPLVIVDGIERGLGQIDANDIESISVLKDASAAVYGFKGANGVILVTTKKGEIGKPKITYNGNVGFSSFTRFPELYSPYEYATLYNEAQQMQGIDAPFSADQLEAFKNGSQGTDWYDLMIRKSAPTHNHNLSVSGGNDRVKFFFSLGMMDQDGMYTVDEYKYRRYNLRSNVSATIVKGFTVDLQLSGRLDQQDKQQLSDSDLFRSIQMALPIYNMYANDNPEYYQFAGDKGNPWQLSRRDDTGYYNRDRREFTGSITFNWEVPWVKGLSAKAMFGYDYSNNYTNNWTKEFYAYTYDPVNDAYNKGHAQSISILKVDTNNYYKPSGQISLNYNNTFGKHTVGALALWEFYNDRNDWVNAYREFQISAIDQIDSGSKNNMSNGGSASESAHLGLVGRLNYSYADKYLAEFSFRYDGSYKFAPGSRWGFFPAVSLGWRVSEENFFKEKLPMVENFKIRGSYGKIGDESSAGGFQFLSAYNYPSGSYILGSGGISSGTSDAGMPNTLLTWYEAKTMNFGFEASAWKGLLSVEFDYFKREREGLLANRLTVLPTTFGQSLPQENLNSDSTKGWELILGHRNKIGKDFSYNVKVNFSTTRSSNEYLERAESANMYKNWRDNGSYRYKGIQWGYLALGQFQSYEDILNSPIQDGNGNKSLRPGDIKFQDVNNDGIIDGNDERPIGKGDTPQFYYGINMQANYKNFDLTLFFQGAGGHSVILGGDFMYPFIQQGLGSGFNFWLDHWRLSDPTDPSSEWIPGKMPSLRVAGESNNTKTSTWTRNRADYLRLKTLEIGYTLPKSWLKRIGIENLRVYMNGYNLLTFTRNEGLMEYMDPENSNTSFRYYPQTKSYNFGVNLTF